ncbi:TPA: hypothetical protein G5V04_005016 [Salmonella enterica]|nr:hypothetical protein [Salmonella enterica]
MKTTFAALVICAALTGNASAALEAPNHPGATAISQQFGFLATSVIAPVPLYTLTDDGAKSITLEYNSTGGLANKDVLMHSVTVALKDPGSRVQQLCYDRPTYDGVTPKGSHVVLQSSYFEDDLKLGKHMVGDGIQEECYSGNDARKISKINVYTNNNELQPGNYNTQMQLTAYYK